MVFGFLSRLVDSNDRELKRLEPILTAVNARADEMEAASADEIRGRMEAIAADLRTQHGDEQKQRLEAALPEILAAAREAAATARTAAARSCSSRPCHTCAQSAPASR